MTSTPDTIVLNDAELYRCLASRTWVNAMLAHAPFSSAEALHAAADTCANLLTRGDWLEAIAAHPRIGDREVLRARLSSTTAPRESSGPHHPGSWEGGEQAGVDHSDDDLLDQLAAANEQYVERFGFIFLICATGLTGQNMLDALVQRLPNSPEVELGVAAEQHRKITHLRLDKLLSETSS